MKIALGIEYNGSQFHGWQKQPDIPTGQGHLEKALSFVANEAISVYCAGRTDTGVHATGQVVHFETTAERNMRNWIFGVNHHLTRTMSVIWAQQVRDDFHARFKATNRRYCYLIYNHAIRPVILNTGLTWHYHPLDENSMQEAANYLIGEHDFSSFRSIECQARSPMRNINSIKIIRRGDIIAIDIQANAFLHHMVRNIAGVLMAIGNGKKPVSWAKQVLEAKRRSFGGVTAPAYGLYLTKVDYDDAYQIPNNRLSPWDLVAQF